MATSRPIYSKWEHRGGNVSVIKLTDILKEIETKHAGERYDTRFTSQNLMTEPEKAELDRRYDAVKTYTNLVDAAIMLLPLDRIIYFHPDKGSNVGLYSRESNGDVIWVVIRKGGIATVFARRSDQGFDYWEDILRGNMKKENIYYMTDGLILKRLKYSERERVSNVIARKADFEHTYKIDEDGGNSETYQNEEGLWDVRRLWKIAKALPVVSVKVSDLEFILDERGVWDDNFTPRDIMNLPKEKRKEDEHWQRIKKADLSYPILIAPDGWIIDGVHRFCKAYAMGKNTVKAYKFTKEMMNGALIKEDSGGATMNTQDLAKHKKKLNQLNKVMAKQGDKMIPYPNLKKTVLGVPWTQLVGKRHLKLSESEIRDIEEAFIIDKFGELIALDVHVDIIREDEYVDILTKVEEMADKEGYEGVQEYIDDHLEKIYPLMYRAKMVRGYILDADTLFLAFIPSLIRKRNLEIVLDICNRKGITEIGVDEVSEDGRLIKKYDRYTVEQFVEKFL